MPWVSRSCRFDGTVTRFTVVVLSGDALLDIMVHMVVAGGGALGACVSVCVCVCDWGALVSVAVARSDCQVTPLRPAAIP